MKVCVEPGCPNLQRDNRCPEHRRGTRQERGYGADHERLRAAYQKLMDDGLTFDCWRCDAPVDPTCWHLGHDDHDRSRYRGPECVPCNTATAGRH